MNPEAKHRLTLARDYFQAGDYEKARPHLEAIVETDHECADVHNMLGFIEYEEGSAQRARVSFERALDLNPRYTEAALNLAVVYNEMGRYEDARNVYLRAHGDSGSEVLDRLNAFVRGKLANMHAELGDAYAAVGLLEHAVVEFRKALRVCPTFVDVRTKLGVTLRDLGKFDEALDELIGIRDSAPDYLAARIHLGITLWRMGRVTDARVEWLHVLDRDPTSRTCRVYLRLQPNNELPIGADVSAILPPSLDSDDEPMEPMG